MTRISCYKTTATLLASAFCQLAQKCYASGINTCVLIDNKELSAELDKSLWTYSRKQFIPHGTNADPLKDEQPIYITNNIENPNNAKIIIIINPIRNLLLELLSQHHILHKDLERIIIIFDETQPIQFSQIKDMVYKSPLKENEISMFQQTVKGNWEPL